jgi:hypothetical protein
MTRTFFHSFDPPTASPVAGASVDLEVSDIEDAGIREVLQTPGAAYGAWSILDALLTPTGVGTPFIFREPLGQAREVKVAPRPERARPHDQRGHDALYPQPSRQDHR